MRSVAMVLGVLTGCALLLPAPPALALRPVREYPVLPSHYGFVYDSLSFVTPDGLQLAGWFYPAQDTAGIANDLVGRTVPVPEALRRPPRPYATLDDSRRPTIILCDGDGGNMADLIYYAYQFVPRGFNVLTFDWRGFGGSAAWPTDPSLLCYAEYLRDYAAALDQVKRRPEVDSTRIALLGFSTGAYLSFALAASRPDVAAVVGRALITSFADLLVILHRQVPERAFHAPADFPRELLPIHAAGRVRVPVFLAVGEKDTRTPPWMSRQVFRRLRGPKELWVAPGAGHGGADAPEFANYPEFFVRSAAFLTQHLARGRR